MKLTNRLFKLSDYMYLLVTFEMNQRVIIRRYCVLWTVGSILNSAENLCSACDYDPERWVL